MDCSNSCRQNDQACADSLQHSRVARRESKSEFDSGAVQKLGRTDCRGKQEKTGCEPTSNSVLNPVPSLLGYLKYTY